MTNSYFFLAVSIVIASCCCQSLAQEQAKSSNTKIWCVHKDNQTAGFAVYSDLEGQPVNVTSIYKGLKKTSLVAKTRKGLSSFLITRDQWTFGSHVVVGGSRLDFRSTPFVFRPRSKRVAVVGHTDGSRGVRFQPPEELVAALAPLRLDAIFHTGDASVEAHERAFLRGFYGLFDPLLKKLPIYLAPGNHECSQGARWSYAEFMRCFPYPYSKLARETRIPLYSTKIGTAEFFVAAYFPNLLGPASAEFRWLASAINESRSPFRIVVLGGNQNGWGKARFLKEMESLPVDMVIMGDGQGFYYRIHEDGGLHELFNGSGGGTTQSLRPYTLIEIDEFELTLNSRNTAGKFLTSDRIYDDSEEVSRYDLLSRFRAGAMTKGAVDTTLSRSPRVKLNSKASTWASTALNVDDGASLRGVSVTIEPSGPAPHKIDVWFRFLIGEGEGSRWFTSQPRSVQSGSRIRMKWPIPEDAEGGRHIPQRVALHFLRRQDRNSKIKLHDAFLF